MSFTRATVIINTRDSLEEKKVCNLFKDILLSISEKFRQITLIMLSGNIMFLLDFMIVPITTRLHIWKKKMCYYTFGDVGLYIPFYNGAYQVVREVFIENIYEKLIGCDKILDLGAYIGDSALYFASHGSKVVGYEMNQNIYALGLFNTYSNPLIQMHYGAVIYTNKTHIHAQMNNMYDNTGSVVETPSKIMVPAYNIVDIVNHDIYDGLKMDIEGSEYDIIQKLMDTNLFCFVRGIIEFHETHKKENSINIDNFVRYLHKHQYKTEFFHNKDGTYVNGHSSMRGIINFYFQKI